MADDPPGDGRGSQEGCLSGGVAFSSVHLVVQLHVERCPFCWDPEKKIK